MPGLMRGFLATSGTFAESELSQTVPTPDFSIGLSASGLASLTGAMGCACAGYSSFWATRGLGAGHRRSVNGTTGHRTRHERVTQVSLD